MFNTTVSELRRINNLTSDVLQIGQVLRITRNTVEPANTYKVVRGDTLFSIAAKFNTTVNDLKRLNNLTTNTLLIGQELIIPSPQTDNGENEEDDEDYTIYEVVKGDSLWLIANRYGITVEDLIELNDLSTVDLQVGDKLKVPNLELEKTYIVKNGDTLWSISKNNNVSVEDLKEANNLTSNLLVVGQTLIIPN